MGFKLGSINNKAVLINDNDYFDIETISNGEVSSNTIEALASSEKLSILNSKLDEFKPNGSLNDVSLDPPVVPNNVFAVGLNYKAHAEESNMEIPQFPLIFTRLSTCLSGPSSNIEMRSDLVDYEAELVFVIGKGGKDISDRAVQFHAAPPQFSLGKSFDTFGPIGPYIVSTDELKNKESLKIECWVNDEKRQDSNTDDLIFDIPYLISYISEFITLNVGDLIFTGTPAGVGGTQGKFLKDGDILKTSIEGIGTLENKCVKVKEHSNADHLPEFIKSRIPSDED